MFLLNRKRERNSGRSGKRPEMLGSSGILGIIAICKTRAALKIGVCGAFMEKPETVTRDRVEDMKKTESRKALRREIDATYAEWRRENPGLGVCNNERARDRIAERISRGRVEHRHYIVERPGFHGCRIAYMIHRTCDDKPLGYRHTRGEAEAIIKESDRRQFNMTPEEEKSVAEDWQLDWFMITSCEF